MKSVFKKVLAGLCFLFAFEFSVSSQIVSDMQVIQADHWIYDALNILCAETKTVPLSGNAPLNVAEIKMTLSQIDEEKLSENGMELFEKAWEYLKEKPFGIQAGALNIWGNALVTPEFYARSNPEIPFSLRYNLQNNILSFPLGIAFSDYFIIETEPFVGKAHSEIQKFGNFGNIPTDFTRTEFEMPRRATFTAGMAFDKWGFYLAMGKEGLRHGNGLFGSLCYNDTFETDFYSQLNLYTERFKYTMDINQVQRDRFLYLHQVEFTLFKNLKISAMEGSFVNAPFELRFLNPLMFMHSFGGWYEYQSDEEKAWYGNESHFCAYLCFLVDFAPFKNTRFYFNYAQTEVNLPWEIGAVPGGNGFQFGCELKFDAPDNGYWIFGAEAIYTSPYLWIKNGKEWSMLTWREPPNNGEGSVITSWVGSTLAPNSMGGQLKFGYQKTRKWNAEFDWVFTASGEDLTNNWSKDSTNGYYDYFPSVRVDNNLGNNEEELNKANNVWLQGVVEYKNQAAIQGTYIINEHFSVSGKAVYTFVFNNNHVNNNFQSGVEFDISGTYRLFGKRK